MIAYCEKSKVISKELDNKCIIAPAAIQQIGSKASTMTPSACFHTSQVPVVYWIP
jgi:hypothetical protein